MLFASNRDASGCTMSALRRHYQSLSPLGTAWHLKSGRRSGNWCGAQANLADGISAVPLSPRRRPRPPVDTCVRCPRNPAPGTWAGNYVRYPRNLVSPESAASQEAKALRFITSRHRPATTPAGSTGSSGQTSLAKSPDWSVSSGVRRWFLLSGIPTFRAASRGRRRRFAGVGTCWNASGAGRFSW
jgi:hypothetical protein